MLSHQLRGLRKKGRTSARAQWLGDVLGIQVEMLTNPTQRDAHEWARELPRETRSRNRSKTKEQRQQSERAVLMSFSWANGFSKYAKGVESRWRLVCVRHRYMEFLAGKVIFPYHK